MGSASYRYYRMSITATRSTTTSVQLSEFAILNNGTRQTGMSISATNNSTNVGEEAAKAGDNSTATKWCNISYVPCTLVYDFGTATAATGYRWATANDATARDPSTWTVDGSNDGVTWTTLDAQSGYSFDGIDRLTFLPDFAFVTTTVLAGSAATLALSVEVAWGADFSADAGTWTWTDITSDVMVDGGEQVTYSLGRQDEAAASQSAQCTLRLDNSTGAYSLGPQAANWPYVRRNTPIRVRVVGDSTGQPFVGYVDSWQPDWDPSGRYAVVNVSASGMIRRLQQGRQPVLSSIRRAMRQQIGGNLIAYWPMEDRKDAEYCSSDIPGHPPLTVDDVYDVQPKFADSAPFACSDKLPNLNYAWLSGLVPAYTSTGELQFRALVEFPANGMNDGIQLMSLEMDLSTTTVQLWTLSYGVGGTLRLDGTDVDGATIADSGARTFDVDGLRLRVTVGLVQNGANIDWTIETFAPASGSIGAVVRSLLASGSFAFGVTLGRTTEAHLQRGFTAGEPVVGHLMVQNEYTGFDSELPEYAGWAGEGAIDRIERLCTENLIYDSTLFFTGGTTGPAMGPQSVTDVLTLLRECETVDQGILYDGDYLGLTYVAHSLIVNHPTPSLVLDASAGRVRAIDVADDDQALRNRVTASRSGGGDITDEDTDGPLGTATVGIYDDSVQVNCFSDLQLPDYAGWLINLGTVEGYRYPRMEVHLRDLTAALITSAYAKLPMRRIDITNLSTVRTQLPSGSLSVVPTGWEAAFDRNEWRITYNCAPFTGYNVVLLDESDDVHGLRANTTGSTLASAAAAGATSLSVATAAGPLWTTDAGDMPMTVEVGDMPVTVSAISGASSPQTFTVTATTLARAAGVSVTVPRSRPVLDIEDDT